MAGCLTPVRWQLWSRILQDLVERLKLKAGAQPNPGNESIPQGLQESLPEAVRLMKKHMVQKQKDFDASLQEKMENNGIAEDVARTSI